MQFDLFADVLRAYADREGPISNADLYERLGRDRGLAPAAWKVKAAIGQAGQMHSPLKRKVRWYQQTLRSLGMLERDAQAGRGQWRLTPKGRGKLSPAVGKSVLLGFRTDLGVALWAASSSVFPAIDEPITLCLTSPPYPLARPRAYGNPDVLQYVDWVCELLEPIVKHLVPGGSICLNVSNDIFEMGLPSRSLYRERLVIALCERLGLHKMDELIWENPCKPPGPVQWSSRTRQQLNVAWEPIYWFTNEPRLARSNNRRVLQQHTERHMELIARGGEDRTAVNSDGAYRLAPGSYGRQTPGRIPRNILRFSHLAGSKRQQAEAARQLGLPVHGATMPTSLARFLVEFLTEPGDLVVDPCGGWMNTAQAAEASQRRWLTTELMGEYVLGGSLPFRQAAGFEVFGALAA